MPTQYLVWAAENASGGNPWERDAIRRYLDGDSPAPSKRRKKRRDPEDDDYDPDASASLDPADRQRRMMASDYRKYLESGGEEFVSDLDLHYENKAASRYRHVANTWTAPAKQRPAYAPSEPYQEPARPKFDRQEKKPQRFRVARGTKVLISKDGERWLDYLTKKPLTITVRNGKTEGILSFDFGGYFVRVEAHRVNFLPS